VEFGPEKKVWKDREKIIAKTFSYLTKIFRFLLGF
jgi:hypothetical protein